MEIINKPIKLKPSQETVTGKIVWGVSIYTLSLLLAFILSAYVYPSLRGRYCWDQHSGVGTLEFSLLTCFYNNIFLIWGIVITLTAFISVLLRKVIEILNKKTSRLLITVFIWAITTLILVWLFSDDCKYGLRIKNCWYDENWKNLKYQLFYYSE